MAKVANVEAKGCCGMVFPGSWQSPGLGLRGGSCGVLLGRVRQSTRGGGGEADSQGLCHGAPDMTPCKTRTACWSPCFVDEAPSG